MSPKEIIKMACAGNADAERFCESWIALAHLLDDCNDRDKPVSDELLASVFVTYTLELSGNPFFLAHRAQLVGLMVQSANAWVDSNRSNRQCVYAKGTESERRHRAQCDVLKGFYHEVVFFVAFLTGGWKALRQITSECREYNFEETS